MCLDLKLPALPVNLISLVQLCFRRYVKASQFNAEEWELVKTGVKGIVKAMSLAFPPEWSRFIQLVQMAYV